MYKHDMAYSSFQVMSDRCVRIERERESERERERERESERERERERLNGLDNISTSELHLCN